MTQIGKENGKGKEVKKKGLLEGEWQFIGSEHKEVKNLSQNFNIFKKNNNKVKNCEGCKAEVTSSHQINKKSLKSTKSKKRWLYNIYR